MNVEELWSDDKSSPERLLWRAVLAMAVKDARNTCSEGHVDAIHWLTAEEDEGRRLVCDLADVDERAVVLWARSYYWDFT